MSTTTQKHNGWSTDMVIRIATIVAAVVMSFAVVREQLKTVEARVLKIEEKQELYLETMTDVRIELSAMEERLCNIEEDLAYIRQALEE